jgi:hypothetical protein
MAPPRGAHEASRFNGIAEGLGQSCPIGCKGLSEPPPKPSPSNANRPGGNRGGGNQDVSGNNSAANTTEKLAARQAEYTRRRSRLSVRMARALACVTFDQARAS